MVKNRNKRSPPPIKLIVVLDEGLFVVVAYRNIEPSFCDAAYDSKIIVICAKPVSPSSTKKKIRFVMVYTKLHFPKFAAISDLKRITLAPIRNDNKSLKYPKLLDIVPSSGSQQVLEVIYINKEQTYRGNDEVSSHSSRTDLPRHRDLNLIRYCGAYIMPMLASTCAVW